MYEVETREEPELSTAVLAGTVGPDELPSWLSATYGTIATHLQRIGVTVVGPPFARFTDRGARSGQVEAGLPVAEVVDGKDQVQPSSLPGGQVAVTWHNGRLEETGPAYEALEEWMARTGVEAAGDPWEVHHSDPGAAPDEGEWLTEVVQPYREL